MLPSPPPVIPPPVIPPPVIPPPVIPDAQGGTPNSDPLTPRHLAELALAQQNFRPIRRAARTARFSAITTLSIGICSAVVVLFGPDAMGVLITISLCAIGGVELIGAARLARAQAGAARLLMRNQLVFLALIVIYCIVQMATFSVADLKTQALSPEVRRELAPTPDITRMIDRNVEQWGRIAHDGFYILVMVLSIICQGGLAWYYATRRKRLDHFSRTTPPWARQLLNRLTDQ